MVLFLAGTVIGRISLLAFVGGTGLVHCLASMPTAGIQLGLAMVGAGVVAAAAARRSRWIGVCAFPLCAALLGALLTMHRVDNRLADHLTEENENQVSRVVLRIDSLVRMRPDSRQFEAETISSMPSGVPSRILVSWNAPGYAGPYGDPQAREAEFPVLAPGQLWRMSLTLKRPNGLRNPHGFDYEGHLFANGVRATGSVRGTPRYLGDEPYTSLHVGAERARHHVREAMQPYLEGKRYGAVLLALAIGDQASVSADDWKIFNFTGISHLISISGSHITMIAAMGGLLTLWGWRRLRFRGHALAERIPAQVAACMAALLVAWLYCLLAGWGVPARRTFLMLAVAACAHGLRLPFNGSRLICVVAFMVVLMDPWALMATGFWLSFGAVCVLLASASWWGRAAGLDKGRGYRIRRRLWQACCLQLAITAGLMPMLAFLFHEVSLVSPLVNAYAIPVISLIVTPLALALAGLAMLPGVQWLTEAVAWVGHGALELTMWPTVRLAQWPMASVEVAATPLWLSGVALLGLALAVVPYGFPMRAAAWALMAPALLFRPERPAMGSWDLIALDVGQAGAVVILTARHAVLFDAGLRSSALSDGGSRIIVPYLKARGVRRLDGLIVSHADIDHVGGLRSVLEAFPVTQSFSSFDVRAHLAREAGLLGVPGVLPPLPMAMSPCQYGMVWEIDGVTFEFLWPLKRPPGRRASNASKERNDHSCVLRIRGARHSALLLGDISAAQERLLVERGLGLVDIVLAAHHGSRNSSDRAIVSATQPSHVIAQVGRWNRYGHPHPTVVDRWRAANAQFWRTDETGAVIIQSRPSGLQARAHRVDRPRYWQGR